MSDNDNGLSVLGVTIGRRDDHDWATLTFADGGGISCVMRRDDDGLVRDVVDRMRAGEAGEDDLVTAFADVIGRQATMTRVKQEVVASVNARLVGITPHIRIDTEHALWDNDPFDAVGLPRSLEDHLVRLFREAPDDDTSWHGWVRFVERLMANVSPDVRAQLFGWLDSQGWLTVTPDGELVGYRGGMATDEHAMVSIHEGPAIVDGVSVNGHVPNDVGSVIEMPRSSVTVDAANGCASGLHVGTYAYACSWSHGPVAKVAVDPADVVSVPTDCGASKIRCCRFRVLEVIPNVVECTWDHDRELTYDPDDDVYERVDELVVRARDLCGDESSIELWSPDTEVYVRIDADDDPVMVAYLPLGLNDAFALALSNDVDGELAYADLVSLDADAVDWEASDNRTCLDDVEAAFSDPGLVPFDVEHLSRLWNEARARSDD